MAPPVAKQKSRHYRQYIVIAVIAVVAAAVILTAILVGMHLFTNAQKDILKVRKDNRFVECTYSSCIPEVHNLLGPRAEA